MEISEIKSFAREWIAFTIAHPFDAPKPHVNDPAWKPIFGLSAMTDSEDWEMAMSICVEIAHQSDDNWVLVMLGCGPLEELLENCGDLVLPQFLKAARENPRFREAMGHVWPRQDRWVWAKFEAVRDRLELPDI